MRGFKIAHGRLGKKLRAARARLAKLIEQRRSVAQRVEIRDLSEGAVVKLATERKHLTDLIKMVAYQAESDLLALLRPHYARADQEGRTLLHEIFAAAGDIRVSDTELHITLAPLSSPHRTHAAQALCESSIRRRQSFPDLVCASASRCSRHHASASPFPVPQPNAAPLPSRPRPRDRRQNRTDSRYPMSGGLNLPGWSGREPTQPVVAPGPLRLATPASPGRSTRALCVTSRSF